MGYHYGDYYWVILLGYYMDIIISMAYYYGVIPKVIIDYNGILLWWLLYDKYISPVFFYMI